MSQPDPLPPTIGVPLSIPDRHLFAWVWRTYLRRHLPAIGLLVVLMVVEGATFGLLAQQMQPMFDNVFVERVPGAATVVAATVLGIFALRAVISAARRVLMAYLVERIAMTVRGDLFRQALRLDPQFHMRNPPGFMMDRVQGDVGAASGALTTVMMGLVRDLSQLVSLVAVAVAVDWRWTLVALIGMPLLALPGLALQRRIRRITAFARDMGSGMGTRLSEAFVGIIPVKLNGLESWQDSRYQLLQSKMFRLQMRVARTSAGLPMLVDLMSGIGFVAVFLYGAGEILSGEKTVGQFMAFFTAIGIAFDPLRRLAALSGTAAVIATSLERMYLLLAERPRLAEPADPVSLPAGTPDVTLDDVRLSYGDAAVLRGLTFTAAAGLRTALVGASGAGKSTVFNLVTRLVDPDSGVVAIGGVPVQQLSTGTLRATVSVVSQDALLFDETIRDNLLLGRVDIDEARLWEALATANAADFVRAFPDGLDTRVGPRGSALSGGQRQRIAIARAVLRDTPVLLLDEATSALDTRSEALVQDALDRLAAGRTTLVIAHRLSTVQSADLIVVVDQGRVVEQGTHAALLAAQGIYAQLHAIQARHAETA